MILKLRKKSEADRNNLIIINNSVWGTMPDALLRTLLSNFSFTSDTFEISEAEAVKIQTELQRLAWNKLVDWLALQEHSSVESRDYLKRYHFHTSIIEYCLRIALERDYINDERYTRMLVESLFIRQKSPQQVKSKLIEKRMPSSIWQPILEELTSPEQSTAILQAQAESIVNRYAGLEKIKRYEKCLTALYRKGFDLEAAREVLNKLLR